MVCGGVQRVVKSLLEMMDDGIFVYDVPFCY